MVIDFENFVYGLQNTGQAEYAPFGISQVLQLARTHGQVVLSRAYADWKGGLYDRFRVQLLEQGCEMVSVLGGKERPNAVDIKMSIDAIEAAWMHPHLETFVIVSGDGDFIPLIQTLKKHGKAVIGVSVESSAHSILQEVCDGFVGLSSILPRTEESTRIEVATPAPSPTLGKEGRKKLRQLREKVIELVKDEPVMGAMLKQLLSEWLGVRFDQKKLGYKKFTEFLSELDPGIVIEAAHLDRQDCWVYYVENDVALKEVLPSLLSSLLSTSEILEHAGFDGERFSQVSEKRHVVLRGVYAALTPSSTIMLGDTYSKMKSWNTVPVLSFRALQAYFAVLVEGKVLEVLGTVDDSCSLFEHQFILSLSAQSPGEFIKGYEVASVLRVMRLLGRVNRQVIAEMLSLDENRVGHRNYLNELTYLAMMEIEGGATLNPLD